MGRSRLWALLAVVPALSACVSGPAGDAPSTTVITRTSTITPSAVPTGPVDVRPITATNAAACPILAAQPAAEMSGMRLARIQVLRQGRTTIGCRFYALQGSPLSASEHLPGPNQPVVQITSSTFASTLAAHNALALLADAGTDPAQYPISAGIIAVAFRIRFDPSDGARDWAVAFNKRATLVVIKTAISNTSTDALAIARAVVPKF